MSNHFCQEIRIPCSEGSLEGRIQYTEENPQKPGVILCPPHPLLAGNMDNNVITALAEQLADDFTVLSFNYRNVGQSFKPEGDLPLFEYWDRLDQKNDFSCIVSDTKELLHWSKRFFARFHLIGYSFGSFIGLMACTQSTQSFTAITPPLTEHPLDFSSLTCPSFFIFAEQENLLIDDRDTSLPEKGRQHTIPKADHFFIHHETEVAEAVRSFLV